MGKSVLISDQIKKKGYLSDIGQGANITDKFDMCPI